MKKKHVTAINIIVSVASTIPLFLILPFVSFIGSSTSLFSSSFLFFFVFLGSSTSLGSSTFFALFVFLGASTSLGSSTFFALLVSLRCNLFRPRLIRRSRPHRGQACLP